MTLSFENCANKNILCCSLISAIYFLVLPPPKRILPGRPKKKRRLEPWELKKDDTELRQGETRKRCGICRQLGYKRNTCPQVAQAAPTTLNATQSSQITQCEIEQPQQSQPATTTQADPTTITP
ncbi:hypothetical protein LR48_Vigan06g159100 [Vigna angularis]|uniref:Uncharacterized protein n=1 Tax=Phaseolus angularis TaxID=3914 RepID=A0A0L9UTS9_PHAAN|nr:hypothetical protein LR48_Vigan06g159100 [Vigna angularis]